MKIKWTMTGEFETNLEDYPETVHQRAIREGISTEQAIFEYEVETGLDLVLLLEISNGVKAECGQKINLPRLKELLERVAKLEVTPKVADHAYELLTLMD